MNELDALEVAETLVNELLILSAEASELRALMDAHERRVGAILQFAYLCADKIANERVWATGVDRY